MDPAGPPSPAPSEHDETYELHVLANHNAATPYPHDLTPSANTQHHALSLPPVQSRPGVSGSADCTDFGLTLPQPGYGNQPGIQPSYGSSLDPTTYGPLPSEIQPHDASPAQTRPQPYRTPATSPPTPRRRRPAATRRKFAGYSDPKPKPKLQTRKRTRNKSTTDLVISKPLSKIAVELGMEPEKVHEHVVRSIEKRRAEVNAEGVKDRGRTRRPLNSFILYRKAYQKVAREFSGQKNHQIISRICGDSWRVLESDDFKARFQQLSRLDRARHDEAWPGYKFQPAKPNSKARQQPREGDDDDDPDWSPKRVRREQDPEFQRRLSLIGRGHTPPPPPPLAAPDVHSRHAPSPYQHARLAGASADHSSPYQPYRYISPSPYSQPPAAPDFDFTPPHPPPLVFHGHTGRAEPHTQARLDLAPLQAGSRGSHFGIAYDGHHHGHASSHSPLPGNVEGLMYSPSDLFPDLDGSFSNGAASYHAVQQQQQQQQQYDQQYRPQYDEQYDRQYDPQYDQQCYQQHGQNYVQEYDQQHQTYRTQQHQPRHLQDQPEPYQPQLYDQHYHLAGQPREQAGRQSSEPPLVDPSLLGPMDVPATAALSTYAALDSKGKTEYPVAPELEALGGLNETLMAAGGDGDLDDWEITEWPIESVH